MPREPRKRSATGVYHVILRGVNQQSIFESDDDRIQFLQTLRRFKKVSQFSLYGYCLMDNHVHLLIEENDESVSKSIQRISSSYVYWYNKKYERSGHLFQERFKSEGVDTFHYFITVLRYILQNPMKAGLATNVFECNWTSINDYYILPRNSSKSNTSKFNTSSTIIRVPNLIDHKFVLHLFSKNHKESLQLLTDYLLATNNDECLDEQKNIRMSDREMRDYLANRGILNSSSLQKLPKHKRNAILIELKELKGASIRQIARLTGISKSVVDRVR